MSARPVSLALEVASLARRLSAMERRLENTVRHGPVAAVDTEKQRARIKVGKGPDGTDQLGPWIPYGQQAGAAKFHMPPTVGQNMTQFAPGGDFEQAVLMPFTWSDDNASPGQGADPIFTYGDLTIAITDGALQLTVGGTSWTLNGAGFKQSGGAMGHDGKDVGATHKHLGVEQGGAETQVPTAGGP